MELHDVEVEPDDVQVEHFDEVEELVRMMQVCEVVELYVRTWMQACEEAELCDWMILKVSLVELHVSSAQVVHCPHPPRRAQHRSRVRDEVELVYDVEERVLVLQEHLHDVVVVLYVLEMTRYFSGNSKLFDDVVWVQQRTEVDYELR